jgi:hypothetical protein
MTDEFDFKEEKPKKRSKLGAAFWNCGSLFFFLATLAAAGFMVLLFMNPFSEFNPLPPIPPTAIPSSTPTLAPVTPTETATATPEPSATATVDVAGGFFQIQEGSPALLDSTIFHPELACNFQGVAGQAFDLNGNPVSGLHVQVTGTLGEVTIDKIGLTGAATQYGAGAYYEVQLGTQPIASETTLQVTLLNASGGPISTPFLFSTTASCQENLVIINFSEIE